MEVAQLYSTQAFKEFLERKGYRKPQVSQENLLRVFVVCASISLCLWLMLCHPKVLAVKLPRSGTSGSLLSCVLEIMEGWDCCAHRCCRTVMHPGAQIIRGT